MSRGPLTTGGVDRVERLAEAAARAADGRGPVAVVRGFNRDVRQRARALRDLLIVNGVPAFEVTPMTALQGVDPAAAVADVTRGGSPGAHGVAARLGVPMVAPADNADTTLTEHDVIGMRYLGGGTEWFDAAFDSVRVMPDSPQAGALAVTAGDDRHETDGDLLIRLDGGMLRVQAAGHVLGGTRLHVQGSAGHRVLRDGMPVAELHGDLEITAESHHYSVTLIGH